jgi:hypothetical protein
MNSKIFNKIAIEPGIYDISNAEYHASAGISRSGIMELKKSPLQYWDKYINPNPPPNKATPAMALGSAIHTLTLEPHKFDHEFIVPKKFDGRTTEGKRYKSEFEVAAIGRQIIDDDDFQKARTISNAILEHSMAANLIKGAAIEKSIYWIDEDSGILCKARPDIWNESLRTICDLKTTIDPSESAFRYHTRARGYHIQLAMIIDGIYKTTGKVLDYNAFIVTPTLRPHKPYIYTISDELIDRGRKDYKDGLKLLKTCIHTNCWDLDREKVIRIDFNDYQLGNDSFYKLQEIFQCQN